MGNSGWGFSGAELSEKILDQGSVMRYIEDEGNFLPRVFKVEACAQKFINSAWLYLIVVC